MSETNAETAIVIAMVIENSRNRRPMIPLIIRSGISTATSETEIEMMVKPISDEPLSAAGSGFSPSSMWRVMFSSMTIASSTTKPTAMVNAISDRLSRL